MVSDVASKDAQDLLIERKRSAKLLNTVVALWRALDFFTVEEMDRQPDEFHELIEMANEACADERAGQKTRREAGRE